MPEAENAKPAKRPSRSLGRIQPMDVLLIPNAQLTIETVCIVTGRCRSTIYAMVKKGSFPAPRSWGTHCTRWQAAAVVAWLDEQAISEGH